MSGGAEDTWQRVDFSYDTNPYDSQYSQNAWGRLGGRWGGSSCTSKEWQELYSYTVGAGDQEVAEAGELRRLAGGELDV